MNDGELLRELLHVHRQHVNLLNKIMTSLDTLTASVNTLATSVTGLTASVDAAVTELGTSNPTDIQLAALTSVVDAQTAAVNAQTGRLKAATTTPPTPTLPTV